MNFEKVKIIDLPKVINKSGNLSFIESNKHIPFEIKRVFWIYDVPGGEIRGGHAYRAQREFIIALSGSFDIIVDDGKTIRQFQLNRSYFGLYLPPKTWRHMENFSTNALSLHLSSSEFNKDDYIYDYQLFKELVKNDK
ncbi:MAG: FdtA/QdtA family cupin domain-containing protein [bacterium]